MDFLGTGGTYLKDFFGFTLETVFFVVFFGMGFSCILGADFLGVLEIPFFPFVVTDGTTGSAFLSSSSERSTISSS